MYFFLGGANFILKAQVGIGNENPDASAVLELKSSNKGLLLPRVNPSEIDNPAEGLLIYINPTRLIL